MNIRELSLHDHEQYIKLVNKLRRIGCKISKEKYIDIFTPLKL